jgi:two-component system, chemotaxis family, chemotaxis protein CheY
MDRTGPPLRVLVADDSAFMRSRIQRDLTRAGFEVVGEARDGQEAAALYASLRPDVVTMDLTMREHDGIEGSRAILALDADAKIVLFSIVDDQVAIDEALRNGVRAYVHKGSPGDLVRRITDVAAGEH